MFVILQNFLISDRDRTEYLMEFLESISADNARTIHWSYSSLSYGFTEYLPQLICVRFEMFFLFFSYFAVS